MFAKVRYIMAALLAACTLSLVPSTSQAVPALQLDIEGGGYDSGSETIVANGDPFTLYAFLNPDKYNNIGDMFSISIAVLPALEYSGVGPDLGSFTLNGMTINVTSDMEFGTPPSDEVYNSLSLTNNWDRGDLPSHGIFPTYFYEYGFYFNETDITEQYNTQDRAITGVKETGPGFMYYAALSIDTSLLNPDYVIHFDLYNTKVRSGGDIDVTMFAPFSHDAESRQVPEPGTLILLGSGLVGVYAHGRLRRMRRTKA